MRSERIIPKLLRKTLPFDLCIKIRMNDVTQIEVYTLRFLLKMTKAVDYNRQLKQFMPSTAIKFFKRNVLNTFESVVGFKIALINTLNGSQNLNVAKRSFNLQGFYANLVTEIRTNHKDIVDRCKSIECKYRNAQEVSTNGNVLLKDVVTYSKYFVYRKLSFVAKSNNMSLDDISGDLNEKAIAVYYNLIPFIEGEHLIRSIKRTVHNEGINMIKFYNASKRKRLHSTTDGYNATIVSIDIVKASDNNKGDLNDNNYIYKNMDASNCTDNRIQLDRAMTIEDLIRIHSKQPVKKQVLDLIMLKEDKKFPEFIKSKGVRIRNAWTPEDILINIGRDNYLEMVREYVSADKNGFYAFINGMKRELVS